MGKVSELLLLLQTCACGRNWEEEGSACFVVSWGSGCQQRMLTVAVLNQTVSRFWRWRECAFRARAVTWKEAGKALTTLTADDTWVRGSTEQKMVAGSGLSGLVRGGCRKQTLCVSVWPCLCDMNVRGEGGGSLLGHLNQASWSTRREVRCKWFLESSHQRLQFGKDSGGWLANCASCLLPMRQEELLSHATWLQPVDIGSMRGRCVGTPEMLPGVFFWVPEAA